MDESQQAFMAKCREAMQNNKGAILITTKMVAACNSDTNAIAGMMLSALTSLSVNFNVDMIMDHMLKERERRGNYDD